MMNLPRCYTILFALYLWGDLSFVAPEYVKHERWALLFTSCAAVLDLVIVTGKNCVLLNPV